MAEATIDPARLRSVLARIPATNPPPGMAAAAVLVLLLRDADSVLLTRRADALRRHPGQVAFPGGRIDASDASVEAAALREAAEEIALDPAGVELLGRLPGVITGTGYHVTPVVACCAATPCVTPAPAEVDCIFALPLTTLRDPAAPARQRAVIEGCLREYWVWPHQQHTIWGVTAGILVELAAALVAAR